MWSSADNKSNRGDPVYLLLASANRDEAVWGNGEELDLSRVPPTANLAFGFGPHIAVGTMVARMFLATALPICVEKWRPFQLSGKPERTPSDFGITTPHRILIEPAVG